MTGRTLFLGFALTSASSAAVSANALDARVHAVQAGTRPQAVSPAAASPTAPPPQASAPATAPTAEASAAPTAAPTPTYRYIYRATPSPDATPFPGPGAPQILEIDLTDQYLVTPGHLDARILTSPEVQTVTAATFGYTLTIPRVAPGVFAASYDVKPVPDMFKNRLFDIDFAATVSNGRHADVILQLGLK